MGNIQPCYGSCYCSMLAPCIDCSANGPAALNDQKKPDEAIDESARVEMELFRDRINNLYNFKILLLGAGESGKSTVIKQIKLSHNKKPTKQELRTIADSLHQNVVDCMKALILACEKFGLELADEEDKKTSNLLGSYEDGSKLSPELGKQILKLWNSNPIKQAYGRRAEFWLLDSCQYYMDNLTRFTEEEFEPNEEDSVMARIRTTGIVVTQLEEKLQNPKEDDPDVVQYQIVDVGGQRNERKKWIHCFDDVKAILFIVNLNAYNQVLFEDSTKNRMHESVELFNEIANKPIFKNTPLFLFLNKKDPFESLVTEVDMKKTYPEYEGGKDLNKALEFIQELFRKQMPKDKELQSHVVTARWKRDIKCAFEEVKKSLFNMNKKVIDEEKKKIKKEQKQVVKSSGMC